MKRAGSDPSDEEEGVTPLDPSPELRRRVLAIADPASPFEGFVGRIARLFDLPEGRARELLADAAPARDEGWSPGFAPGMQLLHLQGGDGAADADCGFVRLAPGARLPPHRHGGLELALALAGRAEEEGSGEVWEPGDLVVREAGSVHGFRTVGDEPFLFAVVLHDGLELV